MKNFEHIISAAQGYSELGMFNEALEELDSLSDAEQARAESLETRLLVLIQAKRWHQALFISEQLCENYPHFIMGYIHGAYCLHEMGRTDKAKELLLSGPSALEKEPSFHYNIACYESALGNLDSAVDYLKRSFSMDKKFREFAKKDTDLEPIRHLL